MQTEKVVNHIVDWLKNYATNAQTGGFVIGISGGIDSAVASALCAKTGMRTLCLEMPIHQHQSQVNLAKDHIAWLQHHYANVSNLQIDLTPVFESFKSAVPKASKSNNLSLSLANTRARFRMSTLYYFAGLHNYLVAGTGNKIEDFGVGFYTKYGDGGVDLSPLADLMKTEVYEIAEFLEINTEIIAAAPTDGLYGDSRSDEAQLGASYIELEWAMNQAENGKTLSEFEGRQKEVFQIYKSRHKANLHKMKPIPICEVPIELKK